MDPGCRKCGALEMDRGSAHGSYRVAYLSNRQAGDVRTAMFADQARACASCGYLELYVDPQELRSVIGT